MGFGRRPCARSPAVSHPCLPPPALLFPAPRDSGGWHVLASPTGEEDSLPHWTPTLPGLKSPPAHSHGSGQDSGSPGPALTSKERRQGARPGYPEDPDPTYLCRVEARQPD